MFRALVLGLLFLFLGNASAFSQEAIIIEMKGKVFVRPNIAADWQEAQLNQVVAQDGEIKTKGDSFCTLAFDSQKKNIITLKDHTQVKVESVLPGKVFLPEGRVFALIKNLPESKKFEVRTLTAVAGARGTGWLTEVIGGETNISCFDDVVYVDSLDSEGAPVREINLNQGFEINVEESGVDPADIKEVSLADLKEWQGFMTEVQEFVGPERWGPNVGPGPIPMPGGPPMPHSGPTAESGFQMGSNQMMMEAHRVLGDNPEKFAEFEQMLQEGRQMFGAEFERMLMYGESGSPEFEAFVQELVARFGEDFERHSYPHEGMGEYPPPGGTYPPPPPPPDGTYIEGYLPPPPPPDGFMDDGMGTHDGESNLWGDSSQWDTQYYYDQSTGGYVGFYDAQDEATQTYIDNNLSSCGHYCCPHPGCCSMFTDPMDNSFCLSH